MSEASKERQKEFMARTLVGMVLYNKREFTDEECEVYNSILRLIESGVPADTDILVLDDEHAIDLSAPSPGPSIEATPENNCHRCGGKNLLCWYADNDVWNAVMRPDDGPELFDGIICPRCFTILAGQNGIKPIAWRLSKEGDDAEIDKLRVEIHRLKEGSSAPLPKEVEEAMATLEETLRYLEPDRPSRTALAVIKAALKAKSDNDCRISHTISGEREEMLEHWKQTTICPCSKFPKMDCPTAAEEHCADMEAKIRALILAQPQKVTREWLVKKLGKFMVKDDPVGA